MKIFISNSSTDIQAYALASDALAKSKCHHRDTSNLPVGSVLSDELRFSISSCDAVIFVATKTSIASQWCMAEMGAFWVLKKPVLVFIAESSIHLSALPPQFSHLKHASSKEELIDALNTLRLSRVRAGRRRRINFLVSALKSVTSPAFLFLLVLALLTAVVMYST